jgi:Glycosyl hydrolase family 26
MSRVAPARHRVSAAAERGYWRSRWVPALAAVAVVVLLAGGYIVARHAPPASSPVAARRLVTTPDHYLGVAEANEIASYRPVSEFAAAIGRQPNLVLYYSAWGDPFYVRLANAAKAHGAATFVQLNPGRTRMSAVAAGRCDSYLRSYADEVRQFRYPVIIGFASEMNASWDRWGWHHTKPSVWIAAWRHMVTVFRQQGADNVTWLWTINADVRNATGPIQDWWPGAGYVNWVGIDGYYYYASSTFATVFGATLRQVRALTGKPVLISETGIGQVAGQAGKLADLFEGAEAARVVGLVWFDQDQDAGIYHQDWRLEGHQAALQAFRQALGSY